LNKGNNIRMFASCCVSTWHGARGLPMLGTSVLFRINKNNKE
jgi:hypothetical protein